MVERFSRRSRPTTLGLCGLCCFLLHACLKSTPRVEQPIQYSHFTHVMEQDIECSECHPHALTNARATIPNIEICQDCHFDEPLTESTEELKLLEFVESGERIPWRKVYSVDSHVYFSHRRHTALAGIECSECHGAVETMTEPLRRQTVPISMDRCIDCHELRGVTTDCASCHR